jgi:formate dehydrogenase subunit delta
MAENIEKLVRMANQIGDFYGPYPEAEAIAGIHEHLRSFWTRSMREAILAHAAAGGEGLQPRVRLALERFRGEPKAKAVAPAVAQAAGGTG